MIDRAIGLAGLALTIIMVALQYCVPHAPTWALIAGFAVGVFLMGICAGLFVCGLRQKQQPVATGKGGDGGGGTIIGNGVVIGGRGGDSGVTGIGGKGGSGFSQGATEALIIGGDGGNCPTADGRGGRGARGPGERLGVPTAMWGFGRGGAGANAPEYDRRIGVLKGIRAEYVAKFPVDAHFIDAGIDPVPIEWVNQRLTELGEAWRVTLGPTGYVLPALESSK